MISRELRAAGPRRAAIVATTLAALGLAGFAQAQESGDARLLRFPDIHDGRVVFSYGGDLWTASADGGQARRLTSHPGLEVFAKFSPDGRQIAFTGQYGGDEQVYVMPAEGGKPRQLTHYPARGPLPDRWGFDHQVHGWTPDGDAVLFRSLRDGFALGSGRLFRVPAEGGLPEALPMPTAGSGDYSPDGSRLLYSPLFRDFRTWKRYQGGWAQDLYIYDLATGATTPVSHHPRSERDPMWLENGLFFSSDRSGFLNLYRYDPATGATSALTDYKNSDVRWPSAGNGTEIVFELDGALARIDTASGIVRDVPISIPSDQLPLRNRTVNVGDQIQWASVSPAGERVFVVARGDVLSLPADEGVVRFITQTSTAHERQAVFAPTGDRYAYVSDADGEEGLWVGELGEPAERVPLRADGLDAPTRWYNPAFSSNGEHLALSDKGGRLFVVALDTGRAALVADEPFDRIGGYTWSPDGRYLAFPKTGTGRMRNIYVYDTDDGETRRVTHERYDDGAVAWSPDGGLLYFTSNREFQPQLGYYEWDYLVNRGVGIFALALRDDVENPFAPQNANVAPTEEKDEEDSAKEDKPEAKPIEFDGIEARIIRVPVEANNIASIGVTDGAILYTVTEPGYYGRQVGKPKLMRFDIEEREAKSWIEDVDGWELAAGGKHVLLFKDNKYHVFAVSDEKAEDGKTLATAGLRLTIDPAAEWRTMFEEVWRRFRDHFYVENMHGYDWDALGDKYRALLPYLAHRSDLNYVLGEMIGELNVSHAYVSGGDLGAPQRPPVALLGARFELDEASGRYRISDIYAGENDQPLYRSPLTEVGSRVNVGEYVLAINGLALAAPANPYALLSQARAGGPLELTVADNPRGRNTREVVIEPIATENDLRYLRWVQDRADRVAKATDGRVGYLHVPDMGANGIREFIKWFYPQVHKEGLVIDVRGNGGGNVSQMLINRLSRKLLSLDYVRNWDRPGTYPAVVFDKPMVTLINETSASDGDIFPAMFREAGLGPLIGVRTWGGIIGITNRGPLLDGGEVFVPEFGNTGTDGRWIIEGEGVSPDIEVQNEPIDVINGGDPQLERGIAEVLKRMEGRTGLPPRPAPPVKTP